MRNRFTNIGWLVTIIIGVLPILIWLYTGQTDWSTNKLIIENLGKMAGLAGLSLFAWSVILSARLKIYNRLFMGLDNLYRAHHLISIIALIMLLCHPMLLTLRYLLGSPIAAYEFLKPSIESPYRVLGQITLYIFAGLMIAVIYFKIQHKTLVLLMRLLGALVFLGGIHAIFVGGSDIASLIFLQIYILSLLAVAAIVYIYRSLFHGSFAKQHKYTLDSFVHKGDIIELHLSSKDGIHKQLPGQFAFIKINSKSILGESHPFTISSSPKHSGLRFSIKQLGDYTNALSDLKAGAEVMVDAPYGTFSNQIVTSTRQIWVAGGIGITPFLAMAGDLKNSNQKIDLYWSLQNKAQAVYLAELNADAKQYPNLRIIPFYSDESGFLTAEYIKKSSGQFEDNTAFLICGPPPMMKAMRGQLRKLGVANGAIHTEEFSLE
jgi:predicted ferric reductase